MDDRKFWKENGEGKMETINVEEDLTFRQKVLLKLLQFKKGDVFTKQIVHIGILTDKEWKYCNSLVDGNCVWFGGTTTRKNTHERGVIHKKNLGFQDKLTLISHADSSHRTYEMHRENIKKYLLSTISKKYNLGQIPDVVGHIEKVYDINLRNIVSVK